MCGIVGYVGRRDACPILIKGLHRLEYRGYDSAGVALVNPDGRLNVFKCKGKVSDLEHFLDGKDLGGNIGIAHTRWATHGVPNDANAHPHYSESENIALIHNGIIENYRVLKDALEQHGYTFRSSTDSEVLVNLIEYVRATSGCSLPEAVRQALRQVIGVVPQKASLVSGTIAENLRWGDAAAGDAELEHACKIAQAWEFVSQTSEGLETKVTQGGRSLSGGQKQRLTIARALVGHPKLLILDDSMSALDYATDLELRRQLAAEMGDVTKIMISQRATSIQHADHILVMDDGKCVGYGTHDELLVQCPVYADIYHTQMQ